VSKNLYLKNHQKTTFFVADRGVLGGVMGKFFFISQRK
jgi:hypothetical protein